MTSSATSSPTSEWRAYVAASFRIPSAVGADSAWYTATAINKAGRDTTRCRVNVEVEYTEPERERKLIIPKGT
ncbi:hypothetical protein NQD34_015220 [Periophthalmus magnuspinnatus]|nr:hypothetical protein NQD34_015220 [Periophthalmus magnuspinnatus]